MEVISHLRWVAVSDTYILKGHEPVKTDYMTWAMWFEANQHARIVGRDTVNGVNVSTVFLGLDHNWGGGPPHIFETMIFGGGFDQETWRYSTWSEAELGHQAVVAELREGRVPEFQGA